MVAGPGLTFDPTLVAGPRRDPMPFLAELRERDPICWLPGIDTWLVTRHAEVRLLFSDRRLTTDARAYERYQRPADPRAARALDQMPFRSTSPGTESLGRRLVSSALTPRATSRLEAGLRALVEEYAAPLRERRGVVDLIAGFTSPVSATAIGRLLGVPPKGDDEAHFTTLARKATRAIRPLLSEKKRIRTEQATLEIGDYVSELVAERRALPRADLISDLVRSAESEGGASDEDITRVIAALVTVGTGTTSTSAARALRSLLTHPEQLALLRRDRSLLPNAARELLRYDSGVLVMPRYVIEDFELLDRPFRKGQLVLLSMTAANRDPRVFPDPDVLDLRRDTKHSLAFGQGPHYCIGANLALIEMRLMIGAALDFLPEDARLLEDEIRWSSRGLMSQINSLPVDFGA
jgi:cytochrome P450